MYISKLLLLSSVFLSCIYLSDCSLDLVGFGSVAEINDAKQLKRVIKARNNVLLVFGKTRKSASSWDKILNQVAAAMTGQASIVKVDCSADRKVCKSFKAKPDPVSLQHYHDGKFNTEYDRKQSAKSLTAFLEDPTGDAPWDEEPTAQAVVHLSSYNELLSLVKRTNQPILLMVYAPWCGHCKRLKPEYAAAANEYKSATLAAMDADKPENSIARSQFNISGYPTLLYIRDGRAQPYGGGYSKDSIVTWLRNPQPPKAPEPERDWSEETDAIEFLTDNNFITTLAQHKSALVMFYAPWCGHCKSMKPAYEAAAKSMKKQGINGLLAAVDATKYKQAAEQFKVKGFPSVKYFENGEYKFDFNERSEDKLVEFMKNPKEPLPPPVETPWSSESSQVQHLTEENFSDFLKKKRRTLVMYYAPWCGHCKQAKPEFTSAANQLSNLAPKSAMAAVDCTVQRSVCQAEAIDGYPTLKHYYFGKKSSPYKGGRNAGDFVAFMTDEARVEL